MARVFDPVDLLEEQVAGLWNDVMQMDDRLGNKEEMLLSKRLFEKRTVEENENFNQKKGNSSNQIQFSKAWMSIIW